MATYFVNSSSGNDANNGSNAAPFKTLSKATAVAAAGDRIQLAAGTYSAASGEVFPVDLPAGVAIVGNEANKGSGTLIQGSGPFLSPSFARQNVTIVSQSTGELRGVTVANGDKSGTGVWVESASPTIANSTLAQCEREGIFLAGASQATITDSIIENNRANGISVAGTSKGTIANNIIRSTGYGLAIGNSAAPVLSGNTIANNRSGVLVTDNARPVLRNNQIQGNREDGLVCITNSAPELGTAASPGGNVFRSNGRYDINNASRNPVSALGNQLTTTTGSVTTSGSVPPGPTPAPPGPTPAPPGPTPAPPGPTPAPPGPTPAPPSPAPLGDIVGHWSEAFVRGLVTRKIVTGYEDGSFRPNNRLTRAEYAVLLSKAFDLPAVRPNVTYTDVAADFWGAPTIAETSRMGFLAGYPDGSFRPGNNLTRVEALLALSNGLKLPPSSLNGLALYRDRAQIPSYASAPLAAATAQRIVVNYPQTDALRPLEQITRGEVAALVYQALVYQKVAPAIDSRYIVVPTATVPNLSDIQGHWAEAFIRALADRGILSGNQDGGFAPDGQLPRAEFAALVARAFNPPAERPGKRFVDVPAGFWAESAIQQAYCAQFLSGTSDTHFGPYEPMQKFQVAIALASGLDWPDGSEADLAKLSDRASIPKWALAKVAAAQRQKALPCYPTPTAFGPEKTISRAEAAVMIYQALRARDASNWRAIDSPYLA